MSKLFIDILVRLGVIKPKTTASVLASFQNSIKDLEEVERAALELSERIHIRQSQLEDDAYAAATEACRASNVHKKLSELIS
jgi:hypothetical protein